MQKRKRRKKKRERQLSRRLTNASDYSAPPLSAGMGGEETPLDRFRRKAADMDLAGFNTAIDNALAGEPLTEEQGRLLRLASQHLKEFEEEEQAAAATEEE